MKGPDGQRTLPTLARKGFNQRPVVPGSEAWRTVNPTHLDPGANAGEDACQPPPLDDRKPPSTTALLTGARRTLVPIAWLLLVGLGALVLATPASAHAATDSVGEADPRAQTALSGPPGLIPASHEASPAGAPAVVNDAGSGRDAGAGRDLAVPVDEGTYTGNLTAPADYSDWYRMDLKAGDLLTLRFDDTHDFTGTGWRVPARLLYEKPKPQGEEVTLGGVGTKYTKASVLRLPTATDVPFVVPRSGTWYLAADVGSLLPPDRVTYQFEIEISQPEHAAWGSTDEGVQVLEARFDEPTNVTLYMASASMFSGTQGGSVATTWALDTDDPDARTGRTTRESYCGTGHTVTVRHPAGRTGGASLPGPRTSPPPVVYQHYTPDQYSTFQNLTGTLRLVAYSTYPGAWNGITLLADEPFTWKGESSDEVLRWTSSPPAEPVGLKAPGLALTGPNETTLDVPENHTLFGSFLWDQVPATPTTHLTGTVRAPDGETHGIGQGQMAHFYDHAPGEWTFSVDERQEVGCQERLYLEGALVPRLDLYGGPVAQDPFVFGD